MATATLTWTSPGSTGTQNILFKKHSDSIWTLHATVTAVTASAVIQNLDSNTLYDFKVEYVCPVGIVSSVLVTNKVKFTCPTLTVTVTTTTATVQWYHLGGDIDGYDFKVYNALGTEVASSINNNVSFPNSNTNVFSALTPNTAYTVKITPRIGSIAYTSCSAVAFTTSQVVNCPAPSIISNQFRRVNDQVFLDIGWTPGVGIGQTFYWQYAVDGNFNPPPGNGWTAVTITSSQSTITLGPLDHSKLYVSSVLKAINYRVTNNCGFGTAVATGSSSPQKCHLADLIIKGLSTADGHYNAIVGRNNTMFDIRTLDLEYEYSLDNGVTWTAVDNPVELSTSAAEILLQYDIDAQAFTVGHIFRVKATCDGAQTGETAMLTFEGDLAAVLVNAPYLATVTIQNVSNSNIYAIVPTGGTLGVLGVPYGTYEIIGASCPFCPGGTSLNVVPNIGTQFTVDASNDMLIITECI